MKFCLCEYSKSGYLINIRRFSCMGCGWKQRNQNVPACMRKGNKNGAVVKKNVDFIAIEKLIK